MFRNTARCLDALFVIAGGLLAHWMRFSTLAALPDTERLLIAFNCVLVLLLFPAFGVYETWRGKALGTMLARVAAAWLAVAAAALLLAFTLHRMDAVSRLWFAYSTLISGILIVATKCAVHGALRSMRRRGLNLRTVAIVGAPGFARTLLAHLEHAPHAGFKPVCVLDTSVDSIGERVAGYGARLSRLPVLTDPDAFAAKVRDEHVNEVWLALPLSKEHTIYRFQRMFRHDFVNLRFIPDVRSLSLFDHSLVDVVGLPTLNLSTPSLSPPQMWPKLIFDRLFAAAALIALAPVFVVLAAGIKLTSPGPVFFRQTRKGVDGVPFSIYKFRSMTVHHEAHGQLTQASRNDARVTKLGAFMRRTSLDELPQFLNVLLGQMSVVGPRPHALEHDDLYKDQVYGYMHRYRIKPGITGWAQVNGYRGATAKVEKMEARVKFDLFYIHNWSFWFDMKIVFVTIFKGFVGRNAF
ncbi:undecaprenyl-phosphate glucose phosphotransferase [bacterium M00.F.Ca.ET.228.01.1.1]|uniref:undecaprenyl-phosphate glucose phosphotransferase n=1 Tax=Paraburkholderia phenoliruptrix TaxID=252970 RepID=UPI001092D395|nr:undecaprenyl-phosphate glucose phosphotransferase [Paraburkholderia phenoliruptrix]TGP42706.1 undecaprenyl-phosphate glucose phosphotransferase [bacterium M00.F.Ca.ET.228.01.1.1]TGR98896.1 undecaprenyl-phosphate glucose phosphotransferase [bacterium M00.F.Ca.ET.191.01.1.1]TGU03210.1 undecaprenyl-phosphate glucose phosphotransferase [bacterium M00.F.Ca.ET.155.01.1.1]MBW0447384.1 undecaprenyl-phosphate glucose phosphotransferase [Paraburkholderia phenoliruptrix]MBW9098936.1 undecaprenyl-phosp